MQNGRPKGRPLYGGVAQQYSSRFLIDRGTPRFHRQPGPVGVQVPSPPPPCPFQKGEAQ